MLSAFTYGPTVVWFVCCGKDVAASRIEPLAPRVSSDPRGPCDAGDGGGRPDRVGEGGGSPARAPADKSRDMAGLRGGSCCGGGSAVNCCAAVCDAGGAAAVGEDALAARPILAPRLLLTLGLPPTRMAFSFDGNGAVGTAGKMPSAAAAVCSSCHASSFCLNATRAALSLTLPAALSLPGVTLPANPLTSVSKDIRS